jgi:DNA modification methylase
MTYQLFVGNNLEILPTLPDNSIDSIVTDPPYGLSDNKFVADTIARWIAGERDFVPDGKGFMGKAWDAFVPPPALWDECLRVLKPGGHLLAFFGSRTQDIGALAIRLAGFEIRDSIAWLYGSGFPKSMDISKAIDKAAGAEREVIGERTTGIGTGQGNTAIMGDGNRDITAPSTPEAQQWQGWGTALKPALEPIVVARKPIEGTVANNVLKWGTGGLNIDGSRIGADMITTTNGKGFAGSFDGGTNDNGGNSHTGRWPANIILSHTELCNPTGQTLKNKTSAGKRTATFGTQDTQSGGDGSGGWSGYEYETEVYECVEGCPVKLLDEQSGITKGSGPGTHCSKRDELGNCIGHDNAGRSTNGQTYHSKNSQSQPDSGGASRFFKIAVSEKPDTMNLCENTTANNVANHLRTIQATIGNTAPTSVDTELEKKLAQAVKNAGILCDSCGISIAQSLVELKTLASSGSTPLQDFMHTYKSSTLIQNLALIVEQWVNTDTIPTTTSLLKLFGSVPPVIDEHIKQGSLKLDSDPIPFLYQAKASKRDRNEGLDELEEIRHSDRELADGVGGDNPRNRTNQAKQNFHPTVKPTALMEYLVKLVTPPNGTVLDPFTGSGSTGKAAILQGFNFIGIEMTEEYVPIIEGRLRHAEAKVAEAKENQEAQPQGLF